MPNRYQINQRRIIYSFLAARDGEYCLMCGPEKQHKKLDIDHMDGDRNNWSPSNLHLLCRKHNLKLRSVSAKQHAATIRAYSAKNERERERKYSFPGTKMIRDLVDYRQGSPEMQANSYYELEYRNWVLEELTRLGTMRLEDAVYGGAEVVGCSPVTTRRYLKKLTSVIGILQEGKDGYGNSVISRRNGYQ